LIHLAGFFHQERANIVGNIVAGASHIKKLPAAHKTQEMLIE